MDNFGSHDKPYHVGILPIAGFALMSYASTVEPLRAANMFARKQLYQISHFSEDAFVRSSGNAGVTRDFDIGANVNLDVLLVVAGGDPFAYENPKVLNWLGRLSRQNVVIGGVSGGPVILVKAGVMNDRRMCVHWEHAAQLQEDYSDVLIENGLFIIDRDRMTCGGGTAPVDMMHGLISSQHGSIYARMVSDWFLHTDIRAAVAPQRAKIDERVNANSTHVLNAVSAMENHIADPLSLSQLAMLVGVTNRHLNRLFAETMGMSTMEYYRELRLSVGRRLIKNSRMTIGEIGEAVGFSSSAHFSNAYLTEYGVRPQTERRV